VSPPLEHVEVDANGVRFAAVAAGPADGPLVVCHHGFPDCALTWRMLLPVLADAGFRAVAPWMRGYAPTQVPQDGCYDVGALAADACALHEALGGGPDAALIGHDWGAICGYAAASFAPERWRRLVTLAVPPAGAIGMGLLAYEQLKRSFYIFVFQHPLGEVALADPSFVEGLWRDWSPGYDASGDLPAVHAALAGPANRAAAIGYYRAMLGTTPPNPAYAGEQAAAADTPPQPTLYLHGARDGCLGAAFADGAEAFLSPGSRAQVVDEAGHFLHLERPEIVNASIVEWLTRGT
jgi:pimeloyl-ACP methyl ester carboxylesterase